MTKRPERAFENGRAAVATLIDIMAALRTPVTGCPWDLEQNFKSIAPYTIEEAYEVADAIERGDMTNLREELGDLLLQVVYHAQMAQEQGAFAFQDVVEAICDKMVRRHPHVFGNAEARAAGAAKGFWEKAKSEEKRARAERGTGAAGEEARPGELDGIPLALPALTRAVKLQDKAARVGFDWPALAPVLAKMKEELAELEEQIDSGRQDQLAEEFGDLMFVMANVARHLQIDPEASLRAANEKFMRRFRRIEERLAERGRTPAQSNLAEMDALWDEAKLEERRPD
jgi:MazG family protein